MSSDPPKWLRHGRIPSLDGMRALAILFVLFAHGGRTSGFPRIQLLHWLSRIGAVGVEVFFVLSGFLITVLILREIERTGRLNLKAFYIRRILRIIPAYSCLLIAVALLQVLGLSHPNPRDWMGALTFTINFVPDRYWDLGHCWSLSIEEHFYLIWPLLVAIVPSNWRARVASGGIVLSLGSRLAMVAIAPKLTRLADDWTFCRLDEIAAGCLLAVWAWQGRPVLDFLTARRWVWPIVLLILACSLFFGLLSGKYSFGLSYTVNAVCIGALVWIAAFHGSALLNFRPLIWVGTLSYSLYLWQQLFLNPFQHHWANRFPQNIVLAFGAAVASYYLIESPFLRLKRYSMSRAEIKRPDLLPQT